MCQRLEREESIMDYFELLPTEENLQEYLKKDLLQRNKDLISFYQLINEAEQLKSIAIDGDWGSGKTFFVKQLELIIDALNEKSEMEEVVRNKILMALRNTVGNVPQEGINVRCVYYEIGRASCRERV